eukprot:12836771-Alexandrium_andersonii.AAC.1
MDAANKLQEVWQNSSLQTHEPKTIIAPRAFRFGDGDVSMATMQVKWPAVSEPLGGAQYVKLSLIHI